MVREPESEGEGQERGINREKERVYINNGEVSMKGVISVCLWGGRGEGGGRTREVV